MEIMRVSPEESKPDKVRLILMDKLGSVALVNVGNCLMFPGGKIENGGDETSQEALSREILEETGISIDKEEFESLFTIRTDFDDYPAFPDLTPKKVVRQTEYFRLVLPEIKFGAQNLTDSEKMGRFSISLVALSDLPHIVKEYESESLHWPFHKEELSFVLSELQKQAEDNV